MPGLLLEDGAFQPLSVPSRTTIGRAPGNDIQPDSQSVSKNHGAIDISVRRGKVVTTLEDLDSRNGTYAGPDTLEMERVKGKKEIEFGWFVRFGNAGKFFRYMEEAPKDAIIVEPEPPTTRSQHSKTPLAIEVPSAAAGGGGPPLVENRLAPFQSPAAFNDAGTAMQMQHPQWQHQPAPLEDKNMTISIQYPTAGRQPLQPVTISIDPQQQQQQQQQQQRGGLSDRFDSSSSFASPGSSTARAQMLYGDDHTDDGSQAYDDSIYQVDRHDLADKYAEMNNSPGARYPFSGTSGGLGVGGGAQALPARKAPTHDDDDILFQAAEPHPNRSPIAASSSASSSISDSGHSSAVDRVSAALAARAAAESTKAQLRQAQALRRDQAASGGLDHSQSTSALPSHTDAELKQFHIELPRRNSKGKVLEVRELVGSVSSAMAAGDHPGGDSDAMSAQDSIERTQMFLRQRLAKAVGGAESSARPSAESAAETAAKLAQQALERQQKEGAVYLYATDDGSGPPPTLSAPGPSPLAPEGGGGGFSLRSSGIAGVSSDASAAGVSLPKIKR